MKLINTFFISLMLMVPAIASAQKAELSSPDGKIRYKFTVNANTAVYEVAYKGQPLIEPSKLGLAFKENGNFGDNIKILKTRFSKGNETYQLLVGKAKTVQSKYNQVFIPLVETTGAKRQVNVVVRAFNDGLAFRYEFPKQAGWNAYTLTDENTEFNIAGNPQVRALQWGHFNNTHEGFYQKMPLSSIKADTLMDLPALFEFGTKTYMAITEANLRDYAGMYLTRHNGVLKTQLSPWQGQREIKVKAILPHRTPWRVIMIGDKPGTLIESNILTNLNEPSQIKDASWIKPGKTSFHWWNGDILPDTTFAPGTNFETNKYYIDFCAKNNIEYHSVIGYGGISWYTSDAIGYPEVGPHTDVTRPVPSVNMQQVCDYAKQKGVDIHVWVHWKAIYPDLERSFAQFEKWGIKGMMVDFLERDDQQMVNIQEEILKKAAEHKLFIQFHGAYKPTGLNRTYPNEFTREGAHNYEYNKWTDSPVTPENDLDIVFTRMLAGATDYHLGGFRAVSPNKFKTQYTRPLVVGTRTHMMAMYVVLESYLAMVADYPEAYEGQPGFEFLKQVPTVWDETKVPAAAIDKYVTIARRKGNDWYIGTINNSEQRSLSIPLSFLPAGNYTAEIYSDAADTALDPNRLEKNSQPVNSKSTITVKLAAGGGHVMRLIKQ